MNEKKLIEKYFSTNKNIIDNLNLDEVISAINLIKNKIKNSNSIFTMGNGGSAHNASHFITDWNKMVHLNTGKKVKGYCLNDNIGMITAYSNDIKFDDIFIEQLKNLLEKDDLVLVVSGSGKSKNILNALNYANNCNADTLAFLGYDGGDAIKIAKKSILVSSFDMQICEDIHLQIGHIIMKCLCDFEVIE